ncbi:MAG: ImmA/IrrE family metallo-endopeptidase [bacterium]|nr:ImmA/IrrE family metallo-endopeptidase [bacterium]
MKIDDDRYEYIKAEVAALFERYNVNKWPIDPFVLAKRMGCQLEPYSSLDEYRLKTALTVSKDGFFLEDRCNNREHIFYNDKMNKNRVKMTVMHEIGHAVLGHHNWINQELAEAEANFFAKYALAPPPLVHLIKPSCPSDVARAFSLSYEAAQYAYNYYLKLKYWYLKYGISRDYEQRLLTLFAQAV